MVIESHHHFGNYTATDYGWIDESMPALRRDLLALPALQQPRGFSGRAARMGDWKVIERYEDGRVHLSNLRDDTGETKDLAEREAARVQAMRERLHAWYRETGAKFLRAKEGGPAPWSPKRGP